MKNPILIITVGLIVATTLLALGNLTATKSPAVNHHDAPEEAPVLSTIEDTTTNTKKIDLALLLDTSNSMDGLIDQAKSQLWNIVDELADAKYDGQPAELHIALYEYGNDDLFVRNGYIRQVSSFTEDLDEISTLLFDLKTNGGSEYCGTVIKTALSQLQWNDDPNNLKLVFIAGNEPFDQGLTDYKESCQTAAAHGIQINTIFCGNYQEGINTFWLDGAKIGKGEYMNIDMDQKTVYVSTPYDPQIDKLNDQLNDTYVGYGATGAIRKQKQIAEDNNAASYGQSNKAKRTISKSKHVYKNENWDLVDAKKQQDFDLSSIKTEDLPKEMKSMSLQEKAKYLEKKEKDRKSIQQQIQTLATKRKQYVSQVQDSLSQTNELERVILKSVKTQASEKGFKFK